MEEWHDALSSGFASVLNNTQKRSNEMIKLKKNELLELKIFFILWSFNDNGIFRMHVRRH